MQTPLICACVGTAAHAPSTVLPRVQWSKMARNENQEEVNARLDRLLRAVSAARGLATASTATASSPQVSVNDYLQRAFPTIRGRHHPGVEQGQRQPSHTISLRTPTIGGGS